jgi:iron(III) transport system substrate-binding protein
VLYTSVDEPFVLPLVDEFKQRTGISVTLLTDAEASKSVGLAERLRAEKDHPQADVWWDNECFLTINLADEGVVEAYNSPSAADIPAQY